jgi:hypothetical protein
MGGGSYKSYIMEHLARMHSDIEATTRKLELEQRRLYNLDKFLALADSEWNTKRARYKLYQTAVDDAVQHKAGEVRQHERKLVKAIEELNKGNYENEQLRAEIDQLRKERTILDQVFKQLEKDINTNKKLLEKEKIKTNDNSATAMQAKQEYRALNKMLDRKRREFKTETKKMQKELHNESEVQKEQDNLQRFTRVQDSSGVKGKARRAYMVADEEEAFSEPAMHRRILKLSFLNTIQRRHIKQHQKNIEVFEQAFNTIQLTTGISDIEEIVKIFQDLEQRHFSLLTYVNQLNREIETIDIRNRELRDQLDTYQRDQKQSDVRKDEALKELDEQIKKTKNAIKEKNKMTEESDAALAECRPIIANIVKYLKQELPALIQAGYDGEPPPKSVQTPEDHEESLNPLLMYIEDAIMQFRICLSQDAQQLASQRPQPPKPTAGGKPSQSLRPELPSAHITGDDSDDDPDTGLGDRPWTHAELKEKALAIIQRRGRRQHGKQMGDGKRVETVEELPADFAKSQPPPARDHAASSIASKDSKDNSGASLSKSPSGPLAQEDDERSKGARPEKQDDASNPRWWRGAGKEKAR